MKDGWCTAALLIFWTKVRHSSSRCSLRMASKDEEDSKNLREAVRRQVRTVACKRQRKRAAESPSDVPEHRTTHGSEASESESSSESLSLGSRRRPSVRLLKAVPKVRPKVSMKSTQRTPTPWPAIQDMEQPQPKKRTAALKRRRVPKTSALGTIEPEDTSASMAPLASSSKKESVHPRAHDTGKAKQDADRWRSLSKSATAQRKIVPLAAGPKTPHDQYKWQTGSWHSWWPQQPARSPDDYGGHKSGLTLRFTLAEAQALRAGHHRSMNQAVLLSKEMARYLRRDRDFAWTRLWGVEQATRSWAVEIYLIVQYSYSRRGRRFHLSLDDPAIGSALCMRTPARRAASDSACICLTEPTAAHPCALTR